jgi:pyrimidine deaminase RibD-like protein
MNSLVRRHEQIFSEFCSAVGKNWPCGKIFLESGVQTALSGIEIKDQKL